MNDATRIQLVGIMRTEMGVIPEYIAREGATPEGYRTFLNAPRLHDEHGDRLYRFTTWTEEQLEIIKEYEEQFNEWFNLEEE